jgi:hypothetical protein
MNLWSAHGVFELKEHFIAIGIGVLPPYWYFWKDQRGSVNVLSRIVVMAFLAFTVWWGFAIGHNSLSEPTNVVQNRQDIQHAEGDGENGKCALLAWIAPLGATLALAFLGRGWFLK